MLVVEVVLTIIEDGNDDTLGLFDEESGVKVALSVGDVSVSNDTVMSDDDVVSVGRIITIVVEAKVSRSNIKNGTTVD